MQTRSEFVLTEIGSSGDFVLFPTGLKIQWNSEHAFALRNFACAVPVSNINIPRCVVLLLLFLLL